MHRLALFLGGIAITLTCIVGWMAFQRGRAAIMRSRMAAATVEAAWFTPIVETAGTSKLNPVVLQYLERHYHERVGMAGTPWLVVYGEDGRVRVDSRHPELAGANASSLLLRDPGTDQPRTLRELITAHEDWAGFYECAEEAQTYLATFGFGRKSGEAIAVYMPADSVALELDRASMPWLLGIAVVALLLMPLTLFLLDRGHAHSLARLEGAQSSLRESQARLSSAIESLPCEYWILGRDGRVLLQNAQAVRSQGAREGLAPEAAAFWGAHCERAFAGESFEIDYERGAGAAARHFHAVIGPVRSGSEVLGVSVLELDLTERRSTERALAHAKRELDFHFENSPLGLIEWGDEMRVKRWSKGAECIFGWRAEEVLGRTYADLLFVHPGDFERVAGVIGRLVQGEPQVSCENRNLTRDGRTIHCHWFNSALAAGENGSLSVLSICQDVTERVRAAAQERMHREVLRAMLEQDGNGQALDELIRGLEDLVPGARASILLREPGAARLRHSAAPSLPPEFVRAIDGLPIGTGDDCGPCGRACATREPWIIRDVRGDPVGERFLPLLERHGIRAAHSYPILAADGSALGSFALYFGEPRLPRESERGALEEAIDLARVAIEYARAQREQAQVNARLALLHEIGRETLQASSSDELAQFAVERLCSSLCCLRASVLLADRDDAGQLLHYRLAAAGGAALDAQPVGTTFEKHSLPESELESFVRSEPVVYTDIAQVLETHPQFARLLASGVRSVAQLPMLSRGKLIGTLNLSYSTAGAPPEPELAIGREAAFLLAVAIERQHLGEALRAHTFELEKRVLERTQELVEANREMETYVHTVTHDLRAPLRTIQGFGQALVEDCLPELSPTARLYVERMIAGAERMDGLMRELLAYSRLGHADLHLQGVDLGMIEREAETLIASELEQTSARVTVTGPLGEVRGHTPTLVQAVANLLSNAAKFVPPGRKPEIRLRPEPRGSRVRLWIEDNGIGIPPESRERIWGVFERLHGVETYPGSGLGLAIVRRALERMHGSCGVESEPGTGSRFWIELEAVAARAEPQPAEAAAGQAE